MLLTTLLCVVLAVQTPDSQPIRFVQNLGQADDAVRFTARNGALDAYLTDHALLLRLDQPPEEGEARTSVVLRMAFEGASDDVRVIGETPAAGVVHSYRGGDSARWVSGAPVFSTLRWIGVAEGVDARLLERDGRLAYDLLLEPGADLSRVVLSCEGALRLEVAAPDQLVVHTALGPLVQHLPAAWEVGADGREFPVRASFRVLDETRFGFHVENRNAERALVIDPGLDYGTFYGGSLLDDPTGVAFAPNGDLLVVGTTGSQGLPSTPGAHQGLLEGNNDAFLARLDASTGQLVYATFFGGNDITTFEPEGAHDLAVSADGSVTVVGRAESPGFPTTPGVVGESGTGGSNGFVTRFDAAGGLVWSTLVGGSKNDRITGVAVDGAGRTTVTGITFSDDFPVTTGAYDESFNSIFFTNDAFVARLAADATSFDYATFVGGSLRDEGLDVVITANGSAVVTGLTGSSDFPATPGAYDEDFNGDIPNDTDAFVLRLSPDGAALSWCTFLGNSQMVEGRGLALDSVGRPVIAGLAQGDGFPTTDGAFQQGFAGGASDGFVSKLSVNGAALLWSSYLGGTGDDSVSSVALTNGGLPTVVGTTASEDFPTRGAAPVRTVSSQDKGFGTSRALAGGGAPPGPGAGPQLTGGGSYPPTHDNSLDGGQDAFITRLSRNASRLVYSTLHGGADIESASDVDVDGFGAVVVAGGTWSPDLATAGAVLDATHNGAADTFLARWSLPPFENLGLGSDGPGGGAPTLTPHGSLEAGAPFSLTLSGAPAEASALLFVSRSAAAVPFLDGVLVAWPADIVLQVRTGAYGAWALEVARWPGDIPSGAQFVAQAWVAEPAAPGGVVASNALALLVP